MPPKANRFDDTLRRYLDTIALTRRPGTVEAYRSVIGLFIRYLRSHYPQLSSFSQLKRSHIETWMRRVAAKPLRKCTKRRKIVMIRCFLETIAAWGWNEAPRVTLFCRGDLPPEDRYLPRPLSEETDQALNEELRALGGLIPNALLLLRATGMRSGELFNLEVDALKKLERNHWALHVPLGKLHSERVVPVDAETARIFNEICKLRGDPPPALDPETGRRVHFLVMRPGGRRLRSRVLAYHLKKAKRRARFKENVNPHRLRHTYATEMVRAGMSLPVLMKILGHRTIRMTMRYVEVALVDVEQAYVDAMQLIKARYEIPRLPSARKRPKEKSGTLESIVSQLNLVATEMEAFRQDHAPDRDKKKIQRMAERLRRLARDFHNLSQ